MSQFKYIYKLLRFAFRENPLLYLSVFISLASVFIELLAMSSLLPLFELVSGNTAISNGLIAKTLHFLGFEVNSGAFLGVFIGLFAVRIITQLVGQSLSLHLGRRVMAQLGSRAFARIIKTLSIRDVAEKSIGYYISLAGDESFRASSLVISITQFVGAISLAFLYYVAIAKYSLTAAGLVLVFLMCSLLVLLLMLKISHQLGSRQTEESRKAHSIFLDSLNNLKAVRAFSAENYVVEMYRSIIYGYAKILFLIDEITVLTKLIPILFLLVGASIWLTWFATPIENIGIAFVVTMIAYLMRFFPVVGQGVNLLIKIASDAKSGKDVTDLISMKLIGVTDTPQSVGAIEKIESKNISFSYYEDAEKPILRELNFKFEKGKSYALSGKSGIGKSTLIDLILKFYQPSSGSIYVNGISIDEIADSEVRTRIILISQEAAIFDDTVMNNVCMGMEANLAEVQSACIAANIHDVIEAMDNGYNTRLQYQGKNLSGGQRQRIAIARAVLRRPDVLILDESTSALDKATQRHVVENILTEYSDKIVIFVTHDPHIMASVDEVIDFADINHIEKKFNAKQVGKTSR